MITFRVTAQVNDDRRVVLTLPAEVPTGQAELVVSVDTPNADREKERAEALERFLALARASTFRSTGPYPTRDELHERR
jgi:hypothetical protein